MAEELCGEAVASLMCDEMLSACGDVPKDICIYAREIVRMLAPLPLEKAQLIMARFEGRTAIPMRSEVLFWVNSNA